MLSAHAAPSLQSNGNRWYQPFAANPVPRFPQHDLGHGPQRLRAILLPHAQFKVLRELSNAASKTPAVISAYGLAGNSPSCLVCVPRMVRSTSR